MRLDPEDHHYIVLSYLHAWLESKALAVAHGELLDFGSGGQPYRALFETKVTRYIAADVQPTANLPLDIVLTPGKPVPMADASIDTVLSSQTLEHVPEPSFYLRECYRVLKPGGALILTAPMQWRHHEVPYDYYRFTRYGLEHLLRQAGFTTIDITPCGGVVALLGQIALSALSERGKPAPFIRRLVNRCALWLDRRFYDEHDTVNWMCTAQKS